MVVLVYINAIADAERLMACEDSRSAIAFLVGIVPERLISLELQVELPGLHLRLLQAEEVGIKHFEHVAEAFPFTGS